MKHEHKMQHPSSPTWCIFCGTFDIYAKTTECTVDRSGRFDSTKRVNFERMARSIFGGNAVNTQGFQS
jgi:hypothetical protein